jgi:putative ABC transport system permease protein
MIADFKFALRMLAKTPGFAIIAVLTLALGIGANSAIFSVIDAVLLRPLPFPQAEQLISVWGLVKHEGDDLQTDSYPNYADFRDQSKTLHSLTAFTRASAILSGNEEARELSGLAVTSDIFPVLGVKPALGRPFTREDDNPEPRVVVLSHSAWKRFFNGDPAIISKQITLSLRSYTVIGVMPANFRYPLDGEKPEYYMPLHPLVKDNIPRRDSHFLRLVGRLKDGVTPRQAELDLNAIGGGLSEQYPESNTGRVEKVFPLHRDIVGNVRPALLVLLGAVALVLLIACANVANLLLARATARQREIAIRTALGASRSRIMRQLLVEGFLLALIGAMCGLFVAWWGIDLLRVFGPQGLPRLDDVSINVSVCLFTLAVAIVSTLFFALVPALQVTKPNVNESLQEGSRGGVSAESHRLRNLLVISQVALSLLLLASAGLLIKSFANLRATKPGFDPSRVTTLALVMPKARYPDEEQHRRFFPEIVPKLAALPGVESAGAAMPLPFSGNDSALTFVIAGQPPIPRGSHPWASNLVVLPDYFRTMRIPLLVGRNINERDTKDSPPVVIVNETFARKFLGGSDKALGQRVILDSSNGEKERPAMEVVGVVGSSHHESLAQEVIPEFYVPATQQPERRMDIVLRTSAAQLSGLDASIRKIVHDFDKDIFVPRLRPMESLLSASLAQPRFNMMLLGTFAGTAMILAAIGIYGVIAYSVAQRTREIGIRMALGAQRGDMLRMVLRQSLTIVAIGLAIGLCGALALTRLMSSLLYGVKAHDFSIYALVLFVLSGAALVASYLPARRAMNVDPMVALRYE